MHYYHTDFNAVDALEMQPGIKIIFPAATVGSIKRRFKRKNVCPKGKSVILIPTFVSKIPLIINYTVVSTSQHLYEIFLPRASSGFCDENSM